MLLQFHLAALALRATWTPAGDGPSRFSKKYRDAIGQDDSKWIDGDGDSWLPSIFPETPQGWMLVVPDPSTINDKDLLRMRIPSPKWYRRFPRR